MSNERDETRHPREVGLRVCCPECRSPCVRKIRRKRSMVTLECKVCSHEWKEMHDDGVVHGLVIIAPPAVR
jgi:uncharacterized protein (DUF983 family)